MTTQKIKPGQTSKPSSIKYITLIASALAFFIQTKNVWSFTVSPMNLVLDCERINGGASFELKNPGEESVAIDIKIGKRTMDLKGKEGIQQDSSINQNFMIYPPRLTLAAKEKRVVRLAVRGGCDPKTESPYRVIFQQLPVQATTVAKDKSAAKVNLLLKYLAALYLKPTGAHPELKVTEIKAGAPLKGKETLSLRIQNEGTAHQVVKKFKLIAYNQSGTEPASVLTEEELPSLAGTNFLPGVERVIVSAWPAKLPRNATRAVLKAEAE